VSSHAVHLLNGIVDNFYLDDARRIKNIERSINHDVKAVEYFLKEWVLMPICHLRVANTSNPIPAPSLPLAKPGRAKARLGDFVGIP
jgi:adenylosuccinate lyase